MATPTTTIVTCEPKPALQDRPPISQPEAHRLAATFKVLANDSRLRLLHALARAGELCVTDLAAQAGMRAPAVSNQLARLVDQHILVARRDGNRIYYRIEDPCVTQLLELGWCLAEDAATATRAGVQAVEVLSAARIVTISHDGRLDPAAVSEQAGRLRVRLAPADTPAARAAAAPGRGWWRTPR